MCFVKFRIIPKDGGFGWKIFEEKDGRLYSTLNVPENEINQERKPGQWLKAEEYPKVAVVNNRHYLTGWSFFLTRHEAERVMALRDGNAFPSCEVIRKIQYCESTLVGRVDWSTFRGLENLSTKCRQARYMFILPEEK